MKRLLNTIYITDEKAYLTLDGETIVCRLDEDEKFRIPFDNVENIVIFSYIGCSPAFMGKCVEKNVPISFISPSGRYLAGIGGPLKGNIFLRIAQIDRFRENGLNLAKNTVAAKLHNSVKLLKRSMHDNENLRSDGEVLSAVAALEDGIAADYDAENTERILGIEGNAAHRYFSVFGRLFTASDVNFTYRSQRPPLDPINAVLSFLYTILTNEFSSALATVGLDAYIGYYHALRSGRASLACDMMEECRFTIERFVITQFNLKTLGAEDFENQVGGACLLNDSGRKKLLTKWQERKRTEFEHPYLKQKILWGLLPYVQSTLMAKYVRGELDEYPSFLQR